MAVVFFLLKIIMESYSLLEQNLAEFHTLLFVTQICLKAKIDTVLLLSFILHKIYQILKNSAKKKKREKLKLNHSTKDYCYIPILSLPHLLFIVIVYSMEYSFSSTKRTHFLQNRTSMIVRALLSTH